MIQFSTDVQDIFHFGEHKKLADIKNAITSTPYMGATTCTSKALEHVANNHMPKARPGVKKQILLLTDGLYNCNKKEVTERFAKDLQKMGEVYGMMIGIQGQQGKDLLSGLVSQPLKDHLYSSRDSREFSFGSKTTASHVKIFTPAGERPPRCPTQGESPPAAEALV